MVSGERPQSIAPGAAGAVAGAGVAAAGGQTPPTSAGETVTDAPIPAGQTVAAQGPPQPQGQQGGGWQGGQQGAGQGGGWQQGPPGGDPGATDPGWQQGGQPGAGGGGGWGGGPGPGGGGPPGGGAGGGWQGDQPPGGKSNKGLLYGIIGAVVLIALGVGAFFLLGGDDGEDDDTTSVASATPSPSPITSPTTSVSPVVSPLLSPSPAVTPPGDDFPAAGDEQYLFLRIPSSIRPGCERQTPDLMPEGASVGITCLLTGEAADFVNYYRYPSLPRMEAQYGLGVQLSGAAVDTGSCPSDIPSEESWGREGTGELGRLLCYNFQNQGRIEWTNNKLLVYSEAVSLNGMSPALYEFWTNAGPFTQPS